jgi:PAS domain S-box-containing protein
VKEAAMKAGAESNAQLNQQLTGMPQRVAELEAEEARPTQTEEAVREFEEKLLAALESASVAIVIADGDGRIVFVNRKIEEIFGYHRNELRRETVEVLLPDCIRNACVGLRSAFFSNRCARPMGLGLYFAGRRKDGTEFPVEVGLSYIKTRRGILVKYFIANINERKRAEGDVWWPA